MCSRRLERSVDTSLVDVHENVTEMSQEPATDSNTAVVLDSLETVYDFETTQWKECAEVQILLVSCRKREDSGQEISSRAAIDHTKPVA